MSTKIAGHSYLKITSTATGMQAGVAVTVVVTLLVGGAAACFITNCPPGGKRSGGIMSQLGHVRMVSVHPDGTQRRSSLLHHLIVESLLSHIYVVLPGRCNDSGSAVLR